MIPKGGPLLLLFFLLSVAPGFSQGPRGTVAQNTVAIVAPSASGASLENLRSAEDRFQGFSSTEAAEAAQSTALSVRTLKGILETFMIPYALVTEPEELRGFQLVYLSGGFYNSVLEEGWGNALFRFVEEGGVLVAPSGIGSTLYSLFGVADGESIKTRYRLRFVEDDPVLSYVDHPKEREISLGNGPGHFYDEVIWTHGYTVAEGEVLARFDDGSAGLVRNYFGRGMAYLLGVSWVESVMLPRVGHDFEAKRQFVNSVEPSADVILLLVKAAYEAYSSPAVYLHTIPRGAPTALILSHDVDAQTSFVDSLKFADLADAYGASATFFQNTKYFVNWKDIDYYNIPENLEAIRELRRRGFDIGSHTVAHYTQLDTAPIGDPETTFADYDPVDGVTLFGEVLVSKELLDRDIPNQETVSFRAGDLAFHDGLIGVLEDSGYLYDSTFSANDVLQSFPFFAARRRVPFAELSNVIEIPMTLDDSLGFLTPETVDDAAARWIEVFEHNAANESITVLLNHPSDTRNQDHKLRAQEQVMRRAEEMGAWMGDVTSFGEFWRSRNRSTLGVSAGSPYVIRLGLPAADLHRDLAVVVGNLTEGRVIELFDAEGRKLSYDRVVSPRDPSFFHLTNIR
jgi:peptidoglycan/xylan/chitin deacetylase (PgdA/CDA1 family)